MKLTATVLESEHLLALKPACDRLLDVRKTLHTIFAGDAAARITLERLDLSIGEIMGIVVHPEKEGAVTPGGQSCCGRPFYTTLADAMGDDGGALEHALDQFARGARRVSVGGGAAPYCEIERLAPTVAEAAA